MNAALAAVSLGGYGLVEIATFVVIVAAVVALVWVALRQFGVSIPVWVQHVFWIVVVAVVVILAIRLVAALF